MSKVFLFFFLYLNTNAKRLSAYCNCLRFSHNVPMQDICIVASLFVLLHPTRMLCYCQRVFVYLLKSVENLWTDFEDIFIKC